MNNKRTVVIISNVFPTKSGIIISLIIKVERAVLSARVYMYPKKRTNELIDLLKINSGRIESLAKCCGGRVVQPSMETEQFEMCNRITYDNGKETFIFGSWKRKNRRRAPIVTGGGTINVISMSSDSESNASRGKERNNKPEEMIPESQRSSTYRPASYESSFCDTETRSVLDPIRDSVIPPSESEILDEDDLWCPRCGGRMTEPRILECLHPICTPCVDELLDQACSSKYRDNVDQRWESSQREGFSYGYGEGCPVCDYPLPHRGSPIPPPHYPLQHRLVMDAVRRRLSHRVLCCDVCLEEVQASVHCPTCLGNFCTSCGSKHEISRNESGIGTISRHEVRPLWEAKRFRRTALCLEHPSHSLRFHCIACRQVTCRECMWRGSHRGHASEGASGAGRRATTALIGALQRGRNLLNSLLIEYNNGSFSNDDSSLGRSTSTYYMRNNRYSDEFPALASPVNFRARTNLTSYAREARERIHEFARLQKARYLLDSISLGEELLSEGSDVEILSLSRIILKRLQMLGSNCANETQDDSDKFHSRPKHTGVFHCCTFCSSGGKKEATCACRGTMPGGYKGCGHGHPGHPRVNHWSCCGSTDRYGCCLILPKLRYQVIL